MDIKSPSPSFTIEPGKFGKSRIEMAVTVVPEGGVTLKEEVGGWLANNKLSTL
jgi:hypothetical protein